MKLLTRDPRFGHRMFTLGNEERHALRITRGRLSRRGKWRGWQPDVFLIWNGRRVT